MPASHDTLDLDQLKVAFDDTHAVANAGLLQPATLADRLGLQAAADKLVRLAGPPGAHPGAKLLTLIHSILAGGDCIDDADVLRTGSTAAVLGHRVLAPSTLGTFLRSFTFGHTRQLDQLTETALARAWAAGAGPGDGAMAAVMAATYPDLYAAVGVHSGLAYGAAHDLPSAFAAMKQGPPPRAHQPAERIPLIVFHGDRDLTVDPINADDLLDHWGRTGAAEQTGASRPATVTSGQVPDGHAYTRRVYGDAADGTVMEQWIIHQAGHAWSGGSPQGSYTDPQGPAVSAELVRFFNQHPKQP
jgi:hypothetical protein